MIGNIANDALRWEDSYAEYQEILLIVFDLRLTVRGR